MFALNNVLPIFSFVFLEGGGVVNIVIAASFGGNYLYSETFGLTP